MNYTIYVGGDKGNHEEDLKILSDLSVNRNPSALSDWSATVPYQPSIDRNLLDEIYLYWDGYKLFRGFLESAEHSQTESTTKLKGRGSGVELLHQTTEVTYNNIAVHDAIRHFWRHHTDQSATVYDPPTTSQEKAFGESSDNTFSNLFTLSNTDPLYIDSDGILRQHQTGFSWDTPADDTSGTVNRVSGSGYSAGEAAEIAATGSYVYFQPSFQYPVASSGGFEVYVRLSYNEATNDDIQIDFYNSASGSFARQRTWNVSGSDSGVWVEVWDGNGPFTDAGDGTQDGENGRMALGMNGTASNGSTVTIDAVVVVDDNFSYTTSSSLNSDGYYDSPALYADVSEKTDTVSTEATDFYEVYLKTTEKFPAFRNGITWYSSTNGTNASRGPYTTEYGGRQSVSSFRYDDLGEGKVDGVETDVYFLPRKVDNFSQSGQRVPMEFSEVSLKFAEVDDTVVINDKTFSGTKLDILQEMHDMAGYQFVEVSPDGTYESFPLETRREKPDWRITESNRKTDFTEYANKYTVTGTDDNGNEVSVTEADFGEIDAVGNEIHRYKRVTDASTEADLRRRARRLLQQATSKRKQSGSLTATPKFFPVGYNYPIDVWADAFEDGTRIGWNALNFTGESGKADRIQRIDNPYSDADDGTSISDAWEFLIKPRGLDEMASSDYQIIASTPSLEKFIVLYGDGSIGWTPAGTSHGELRTASGVVSNEETKRLAFHYDATADDSKMRILEDNGNIHVSQSITPESRDYTDMWIGAKATTAGAGESSDATNAFDGGIDDIRYWIDDSNVEELETLKDSYNGNDATLTDRSTVFRGEGYVDEGIRFDGNVNSGSGVVQANTNFGNPQQFSVAFWIHPDELSVNTNNNYRKIVEAGGNFIILEESNRISFRVPGVDTSNFTAGNVPVGAWSFVVCVYDGADRVIYVDGQEVGRQNIGSGTVDLGDIQLNVDGGTSPHRLIGELDEWQLFSTALTGTEVSNLYNGYINGDSRPIISNGLEALYTAEDIGLDYDFSQPYQELDKTTLPNSGVENEIYFQLDEESTLTRAKNTQLRPVGSNVETITTDDFEDNDLSEYTSASGFTTAASSAYEGSYGLEATQAGTIYSQSGLEHYPSIGDEIKYRFRLDDFPDGDPRWDFNFATQDTAGDNMYQLRLEGNEALFNIWNNGSSTTKDLWVDSTSYTTVDDFEDADLSEYTYDYYGEVTASAAHSGSYGLHIDAFGEIYSLDGTGLNAYPSKGDEFEVYIKNHFTGNEGLHQIYFGLQEDDNKHGYSIRFNLDGDLGLYKRDETGDYGGSEYLSTASTNSVIDAEWHRVRVRWDDGSTFGGSDGDITVNIYDSTGSQVATMSGNDTTWNSGGVGFRCSGDGSADWDDFSIINRTEALGGNGGGDTYPGGSAIVDGFEDGDFSEYGSSGYWSLTSGAARSGSFGLDAAPFGYRYSTSGLDNYPSQGDEFEAYFRLNGTSGDPPEWRIWWGVQSESDSTAGYRLRMQDDYAAIVYDDGSSATTLDSTATTISTGGWHRINVKWDDGSTFGGTAGDMTVTIYDSSGTQIVQLSGNDNSLSSGGIGWWANGYADVHFDDYTLLNAGAETSWSLNDWYEATIDWSNNNTFDITVENLNTGETKVDSKVEDSDTLYTGGGYGIGVDSDVHLSVDAIFNKVVTEETPPRSGIITGADYEAEYAMLQESGYTLGDDAKMSLKFELVGLETALSELNKEVQANREEL